MECRMEWNGMELNGIEWNGEWRMEWRMENGEWRMEKNGEWRMENGEWRMENGEWRMEWNGIVNECMSEWVSVFVSNE